MSNQKRTIRLLLLEDSQNEAERLVSLFRNAGHVTRVHRLTSSIDLAEILKQTWDLLICAPRSANLDPTEAIAAVRRQAKDIPAIQLLEQHDSQAIADAMKLGAQDALPQGEDQHLLLIANRELSNLEERRARRAADVALREIEKRCQLLLESSVDAITYVHDGMHIYANHAYLALFGYEDADELEGMPMIDLIASADQARFKDFLKHYHDAEGHAELACEGMKANGQRFAAQMGFSPATYDGEPCIQVIIRPASANAELEEKLREISSQDLVTGLFNRNHFIELMDQATDRAINAGQQSSLLYIRVDRYANLQAELGLSGIDMLLTDLANLLRQHSPPEAQLARFGDDVFSALLPDYAPEQILDHLQQLLKSVESHLFEVNGRTVQTTLSIGVAVVNETTGKAQEVLDRAHRCADELGEGNGLKLFDPADELAAAAKRGDIAAMIQQSLEQNAFRLLFQPIISLRGDPREHYEVLLRLVDSHDKEVSPRDFLLAAIESHQAAKVDRWVLLNAIQKLVEHRAKGHDTCLFIHLSSDSLQDPTLLPWLSAALKAARLPADALVLQLNEPDAVNYLKQAKALTQGLAQLHCKVALSQFGGALNPFNTLKHLHLDYVKLDAALTRDLSSPESQEALKNLVGSLQAQAKLSIVPYVESASVLSQLWQAGVNYIQGHYLQAPSQSMNYDFSGEG